ncbi:MAG: phenylalanine--tRNA ligase subunit beta [Tepidisphaera sp.]|nr:phenylalanine--tRNA ligase subunit beta [Tepidisphaera sp.]
MNTSLRWITSYLPQWNGTPEQAEQALIHAGFPIESREVLSGGDVRLDVEITSNRGDCLSHLGLARELAAKLRLALKAPDTSAPVATGPEVGSLLKLENAAPNECPRFLARVIRGIKVGPSPAWLAGALEAAGQRSINNVVDATNWVCLELGNPCHAFDLKKLAGPALVVRRAREGEALTTLDGKKRTLRPDQVVVADAERAQSLAGVMGGGDSEVSSATTDLVLEVATWDPNAVRRAARHHQLRTDASHRFERIVTSGTLDDAMNRLAGIVLQVAGGELAAGVLEAGAAAARPTQVQFRPSRCNALLGTDFATDDMVGCLARLGVVVQPLGRGGETLLATIPAWRPDLTREVDLIEEVARVMGLEAIPQPPQVKVAVRPAQTTELARAELASVLTGLGFFEGVTFSFTTPELARAFCPGDLEPVVMDDARRGEEPALRPSVLAGLLASRRHNQHAGVQQPGGVRLFETAAVFAQRRVGGPRPETVESRRLGMILDCPGKGVEDIRAGVRLMRGVIETLAAALVGHERAIEIMQATPTMSGFDASCFASVRLGPTPAGHGSRPASDLGWFGLFSKDVLAKFDLARPAIGAELDLDLLLHAYPPASRVKALPAFPGIERDVSLVVPERVAYDAIRACFASHGAGVQKLEGVEFVGAYRGKPLAAGTKSVTVRLAFRDPSRTLTNEEIDAPFASVVEKVRAELGAEVRA